MAEQLPVDLSGESLPSSEQSPQQREELRRRRRRRARRRTLRRLLGLLLVAVVAFLLWKNWDTVAPDKLLARLQDSMNNTGDGWPVDIAGTNVTGLVRVPGTAGFSGYTATLGDSYLVYYNDKGSEATRYPCSYSSAVLRSAGKYALLAEQNGRRVQLTTRTAKLLDLTVEEKILSAAVNEKGHFALLTQGPQGYTVQVTVYDRKGATLYSRSRKLLATEVALSADGSQVALLSVKAENGILQTVVESFSLTSADTEAVSSYTAQDTLLYRLAYLNGNRLAAVGETGVLVLDAAGAQPQIYDSGTARVLGYAAGNGTLALALRDYGDTAGGRVVVLDQAAVECCTVDFSGEFRHISADGDSYLLLTDSRVQQITRTGAGKAADVAPDGQKAVLASGSTAVVLGLSTVQAYELH